MYRLAVGRRVGSVASGRCSFCGLRRSEVDSLVVGDRGAAICTGCAALAANVVSEPIHLPEVVYAGLSAVVTNDPRIGPDFGTIKDAAIVVRSDHVAWIGKQADLPERYQVYPVVECGGRIAVPGFVDAGVEALGGVPDHRPDPDPLIGTAAAIFNRTLAHGVTMVDVRVGGSGEPTIDMVMLAAARAACDLAGALRVGITWTAGKRMDNAYLDSVMAPTVGRIASAVHLVCDGSVDASSLRAQLAALRRLPVRIRLCEEHPQACATLAAGAQSVESDRWSLLPADTTPLIEPLSMLDGAVLDLRALWTSGGRPAIATRSNPDGRMVAGFSLPIALLVSLGGLTVLQALWAATRGGALAMADDERGRLRVTDPADFVVLDTGDLSTLVDRPDTNPVWKVVAGGREAL